MKYNISFFKKLALLAMVLPLLIYSCAKPVEKDVADITDIAEPVVAPGWITFKPDAKVNPKTLFKDHAVIFHLPKGNEMVLQFEETDPDGTAHLRYRQFFNNVEVENAEFLVRAKDNLAISANGRLAYDFQPQTTAPQLSEEQAWQVVQRRIPAERYFREDNFVADLADQTAAAARTPYRPKASCFSRKILPARQPSGDWSGCSRSMSRRSTIRDRFTLMPRTVRC